MKKLLLLLFIIPSCQLFAQLKIATTSTNLCEGTNVTFDATGIPTNASIQWQKNGIDIQNANAKTYQTSASGNYSVKAVSGTNSWVRKTPTEEYDHLLDVYFINEKIGYAVGANGTIIKTINGGANWESQISKTTEILRAVFFTDEQNGWIVGMRGEILKTSDGGSNWVKAPKTWTYDRYFENIFFLNPKVGWILGSEIILKTTNGGETWTSMPQYSPYVSVYAIFFTDAQTGWVADYFGSIYKTTDGGATWRESYYINDNKPFNEPQESGLFRSIFFTDSNNGWAVGSNGLMITTSNGGITWTRKKGVNDGLYLTNINFSDTKNGFAFSLSNEYLQTTDGGNTWIKKSIGLNTSTYSSFAFGKNNIWSVGNEGTIINTIDGGLNWKILRGNPQDLSDINFVNSSIGYKVGNYGSIEKTIDGGVTWKKQNSGVNNAITKVKFVDENTGWALIKGGIQGSQGSVLRTVDGGNTWTNHNIYPKTIYLEFINEMFFNDAKDGFVVGFKNAIYNTKDGGVTWNKVKTTLDSNQHLESVFFSDSKNGWAVGYPGNIVKTTDGGETWTKLSIDEKYKNDGFVSVWFNDTKNGWVVKYPNLILKTTDAGISWTEFELENKTLKSIIFTDNKTGWVTGESGLLLKTIDGGITWETQQYNSSKNLNGLFFSNTQNGWAVGAGNTLLKYELQVLATSNTVTINTKPNVPSLTWSNNDGRLIATSITLPVQFAWFKGNDEMKNFTASDYRPSSSGAYRVRVTDSNSCSEYSKSIDVSILGNDSPFETSPLSTYPNPNNNGILKVAYSNVMNNKVAELQIIGIDGLSLHNQKLELHNNAFTGEVDLSSLSSGIYFLQVVSGEQKSVVKISVMK
ncbi:YCF48-related protein [Arcicella aquatica]|uniref:YCF48-related protein n=1 Tax=Arcicella aquatica TaxID=217141 RepID=A0ABU5QHA6_9BACT|nr:YCF48-related protein [Arcicella aquatica]MEA5256442.1 YCF48-related protein [Arcicella aquatica]